MSFFSHDSSILFPSHPVLRTLSNPENLPALVSCAHGKDRTGIVTAMILSILGKSDEYIAEEYAMSEVSSSCICIIGVDFYKSLFPEAQFI